MARNKEKKSAWFYIMVIVAFFFVWLTVAQMINKDSTYDYEIKENLNQEYHNNVVPAPTETIIVSGMNNIKMIDNSNVRVKLTISGVGNVITITKNTDVIKIILSGQNNKINLCSGIHSPSLIEGGLDNNIIYRNC